MAASLFLNYVDIEKVSEFDFTMIFFLFIPIYKPLKCLCYIIGSVRVKVGLLLHKSNQITVCVYVYVAKDLDNR